MKARLIWIALSLAACSGDESRPDDETTATTTSSTTMVACEAEPDFLACAQCVCNENTLGCLSYLDAQDANIYCGMTCVADCGAFCQTVQNGAPDVSLVAPACASCTDAIGVGNPDLSAFVMQCEADPNCSLFVQQVDQCPNG